MNKHPKHSSSGELSICWEGYLSLEVDQLIENIIGFFFLSHLNNVHDLEREMVEHKNVYVVSLWTSDN